jgi:hypothetical protein
MMPTPSVDAIFEQIEQLSVAEKALLIARIAPSIADALHSSLPQSQSQEKLLAQLPPDSPAAQLARTPGSALAKVLAIFPDDRTAPTDAEVARWRDERLAERYGV